MLTNLKLSALPGLRAKGLPVSVPMLVYLALFAHVIPASADKTFTSSDYGIALIYPDEFEPVVVPHPSVPLSLRHRQRGYPTLNIVVESGEYNLRERTTEQNAAYILDSYRSIGLTDARLLQGEFIQTGGRPAFRALVAFSDQSAAYQAAVVLLSGSQRHFILTFLDRADQFENDRQYLDRFLANLQLTDQGAGQQQTRKNAALLVLVPIVLLAGALFFFWRRRRR